jgi:chromosome segregation ATPase
LLKFSSIKAQSLADLNEKFDQQNNLLADFEAEAQAKDHMIIQLKVELADKNTCISRLQETLKVQQQSSRSLTSSVSDKRSQAETESLVQHLEAEQLRYRAEIKAQLDDIQGKKIQMEQLKSFNHSLSSENNHLRQQLQGISQSSSHQSYFQQEEKQMVQKAKQEALSCIAELKSLKQLIQQALSGKDPSFHLPSSNLTPTKDDSLISNMNQIKQEAVELRSIFTTAYAETLGNDCAVQ